MKRALFYYPVWPLVALGCLLAAACLIGVWYINKLDTDLGHTVQHDVRQLQAAEEMQIALRQLRFHSVLYAAQRTADRHQYVLTDERAFETALADFLQGANAAQDGDLTKEVALGYDKYKAAIDPPGVNPATTALEGEQLLHWADEHPVKLLLSPCRELAQRQQERMSQTLQRTELQNRWAGRGLLAIGCVGVLGGILSGYAAARHYSRAVGLLSVRVQAAQAELDQEVGTLTVAAPQRLGDLDQQLDTVVDRIRDLCERLQRQEREILRAEHLAAVGHLAAGVAHEVRNPLTGMRFLIEAAMRPDQKNPLTHDDLSLIHHEILRIERTVQELLNYARTPALRAVSQDARELIGRVVELGRSRANQQHVELAAQLPDSPLMARLDTDQFTAMLTNLLFNALDATPAGGRVDISASRSEDDSLKVEVTDTGPGIAPAAMEKLFTPFATTKPTGTGLGLTMARRIARDHGGVLTASNRQEGGACFTFRMPATEPVGAARSVG